MSKETIHITDNNGDVTAIVKRKIHDRMVHSTDPDIKGYAIESGYITYKGGRFIAGLERLNGRGSERWTAFSPI